MILPRVHKLPDCPVVGVIGNVPPPTELMIPPVHIFTPSEDITGFERIFDEYRPTRGANTIVLHRSWDETSLRSAKRRSERIVLWGDECVEIAPIVLIGKGTSTNVIKNVPGDDEDVRNVRAAVDFLNDGEWTVLVKEGERFAPIAWFASKKSSKNVSY